MFVITNCKITSKQHAVEPNTRSTRPITYEVDEFKCTYTLAKSHKYAFRYPLTKQQRALSHAYKEIR